MALARVKVWIPGDILTASDLNAEFNNQINNPISLISPTTGAINFNLQAHTNFVLENVATTPTAATSGRIVYNTVLGLPQVDQATVVRSIPMVLATELSTGSLLVYTSSGAFSVIPIGSSGQVLTVSSSNSSPAYAAATGSGSATLDPSATWEFYEDFLVPNRDPAATGTIVFSHMWNLVSGVAGARVEQPNGILRLNSGGGGFPALILGAASAISTGNANANIADPTKKFTMKLRFMQVSSSEAFQLLAGLASSGTFASTSPANGIFFLSTTASGTVQLVSRAAGVESTLSAGVTTSDFHHYSVVVTTSELTLSVDGVSVGSITTNIPSVPLTPGFGVVTTGGFQADYFYISSTAR